MNRPPPALLKARKAPQQARSAVTIEAIHVATIQVLLAGGVGRLTTTRVAARAGVSVGTMYQYYPHKQALLFALVERQFDLIEAAMRDAAARLMGSNLKAIAEGLATAWLDAKMADMVASRAIYGIAAEFDLSELMSRAAHCMTQVIDALLAQAPEARFADRSSVAFMLAALLGGSVRVVMEAEPSEEKFRPAAPGTPASLSRLFGGSQWEHGGISRPSAHQRSGIVAKWLGWVRGRPAAIASRVQDS